MPGKYVPVGRKNYARSKKTQSKMFVSRKSTIVVKDEKRFSEEATLKTFSLYCATLEKHRRAVPKGKEIRS
jgi:hypothetical protein